MSISVACPHCGETFEVAATRAGQRQPCAACGKLLTIPNPNDQNRFAGSAVLDQLPFRPTFWGGLLAAGMAILLVLTLILPWLQRARSPARRNMCINNLKNLGLAMHNHHEFHRRLPLASSQPRSGRPGSGKLKDAAGYGWHVALLPFMEEEVLYRQFETDTPNFILPPFDPAGHPEYGCAKISLLKCPTDSGPDYVETANSAYQVYPNSPQQTSLARSTYVAFAVTHFMNESGLGELADASPGDPFDGNGAFPFPIVPSDMHQGLSFKAFTDGTSKTVMLTETRERAYAAWLDGQATWVIAAWQGHATIPTETGTADGMLGWTDSDLSGRATLSLDPLQHPDEIYLTAERYGAGHDRHWGPSSEHAGGAVNHVFIDGHVSTLMPDIDRNLYLRLISRGGGEPVNLDD